MMSCSIDRVWQKEEDQYLNAGTTSVTTGIPIQNEQRVVQKSDQSFILEAPFDFDSDIKKSGPNVFVFNDLASAESKKSEIELERTERYVLEKCPKDFGSTSKCRFEQFVQGESKV